MNARRALENLSPPLRGLIAAGRDILTRLEENSKDSSAPRLALDKDSDALFAKFGTRTPPGKRSLCSAAATPYFSASGPRCAAGWKTRTAKTPSPLTIIPNISSLQAMAARLALPWENIPCVSLHGRSDL